MSLAIAITQTRARLDELSALVEREPEFANWTHSGPISPQLIQLFPTAEMEEAAQDRRAASARAVARAFGGEWYRETDGCWRNNPPWHGSVFRVVLHRIEPVEKKEYGPAIDLS